MGSIRETSSNAGTGLGYFARDTVSKASGPSYKSISPTTSLERQQIDRDVQAGVTWILKNDKAYIGLNGVRKSKNGQAANSSLRESLVMASRNMNGRATATVDNIQSQLRTSS